MLQSRVLTLGPPGPPPLVHPRHQWYQLQNRVTLDVYAKNLGKDQVRVSFKDSHLTLVINDASGQQEYEIDVELYGKVTTCIVS